MSNAKIPRRQRYRLARAIPLWLSWWNEYRLHNLPMKAIAAKSINFSTGRPYHPKTIYYAFRQLEKLNLIKVNPNV